MRYYWFYKFLIFIFIICPLRKTVPISTESSSSGGVRKTSLDCPVAIEHVLRRVSRWQVEADAFLLPVAL
jgi:hypothetical protein